MTNPKATGDLVEQVQAMIEDGTVFHTWTPTLRKIIAALSASSSEEVAEHCRELTWFRGCDEWELEQFLVEINNDRKKSVDLLQRLDRQKDVWRDMAHEKSQQLDLVTRQRDERDALLLSIQETSSSVDTRERVGDFFEEQYQKVPSNGGIKMTDTPDTPEGDELVAEWQWIRDEYPDGDDGKEDLWASEIIKLLDRIENDAKRMVEMREQIAGYGQQWVGADEATEEGWYYDPIAREFVEIKTLRFPVYGPLKSRFHGDPSNIVDWEDTLSCNGMPLRQDWPEMLYGPIYLPSTLSTNQPTKGDEDE